MKLILIVIGMVLLCGIVYANIGYTEINLIDYDTNKFININSSVPLSYYTFELKTGRNWIGIPFNTTIHNADIFIKDIQPECSGVAWLNPTTQTMETYVKIRPNRYGGTCFDVKPCRGYEVTVSSDTMWTIECLQPINPILQYQCFDLNKYIGTNIVRVRNI